MRTALLATLVAVTPFVVVSCGSDDASSSSTGATEASQASEPSVTDKATTTTTQLSTTTTVSKEGTLVFGKAVDGGPADIYAFDGTSETQLTTEPSFDVCAALSPDGTAVVFCSDRSGTFEIWMMNRDGTNQHQVTKTGGYSVFPKVSPDGTKIAFSGAAVPDAPDEAQDIWVINVDGTGLTQLTTTDGIDAYPSWSPDGGQLAWLSIQSGATEIWAMNPDGTDPHALTHDEKPKDQMPTWSPDGSKIAYQSAGTCAAGGLCGGDIYVMNADGSNPLQLTTDPGADAAPTWSPDGSQIAFVSDRTGTNALRVVNADGTNDQPLLGDARYFAPSWG